MFVSGTDLIRAKYELIYPDEVPTFDVELVESHATPAESVKAAPDPVLNCNVKLQVDQRRWRQTRRADKLEFN